MELWHPMHHSEHFMIPEMPFQLVTEQLMLWHVLLDASTVGNAQVIGEEKWVALYPLGYDAWSEWRRTEVPALTPAADAINSGDIPRRYNYPSDEATLNTTNYNAGVSSLSPATDNNTSKVWWNQ